MIEELNFIKNTIDKFIATLAKDLNLNKIDIYILLFLSNNQDKDYIATHIVDSYIFSKANISNSISNLEKQGFITRETDQTDKKRVIIKIAPANNDKVNTIIQSIDNYNQKLFNGFTPQDQITFNNYLKRIKENLNNIEP